MTLYTVQVGKHEYQIRVSDEYLSINDEQIQASMIPLNEVGAYLMKLGDRKREVQVSAMGKSIYSVTSRGRKIQAKVEKGSARSRQPKNLDTKGALKAPMPGIILSVLVHVGERVEKDQALVVMESMKMQMEMRSPISGWVEKVLVKEKGQVDKDSELVRIKEES
jgi:biotin carboxyl carrier protein